MATDYLNRRMDLHHSVFDGQNYLTMDTSYPIKLSGKIIKIFTAFLQYQLNGNWYIKNSEDETVLTINHTSVYDFAGRVIDNNIGEDKPYTVPSDVFKSNDYVMAIIDFSGPKLFLCSQTNFSKFITSGEDNSNLKMFTIDGETAPGDNDVDIDYNYDAQSLADAIAFESEEGRHALVRFVNGNNEARKDSVLYQEPEIIYDEVTGDPIGKRLTPVAKIDSIDISKPFATVYPFMFGYTNTVDIDDKAGTNAIDKFAAFMTISAPLTQQFLTDYAFSADEVMALPIVTTASKRMKAKMLEEYNNISDKSRYKFVLMSIIDNPDSSGSQYYDKSLKFIPVDTKTNEFSSLFRLNNRGFVVGGTPIELPAGKSMCFGNFGALEANDSGEGYRVIIYTENRTCMICKYLEYDYDDNPIAIHDNDQSTNSYQYSSYADNAMIHLQHGPKDLSFYTNSPYAAQVTRFVDFFCPETTNRADDIKGLALAKTMSFTGSCLYYKASGGGAEYPESPNTVVMVYPDSYESDVFSGSGNISDQKYPTFLNRVSPKNHREIMAIVYDLFNTQNLTGYIENDKLDELKKCVTTNAGTISTHAYKYKATRTLSTDGTGVSNYNLGLVYNSKNVNYGFMFSPISILSVVDVGEKAYYTTYNPAEVTVSNIMVAKKIYNAGRYIEDDSDGNLLINSEFLPDATPGIKFQLYVVSAIESVTEPTTGPNIVANFTLNGTTYVCKKANWKDSYPNFKNPNSNITDYGKYLYMYYVEQNFVDSSKNKLHRIKYYYRTGSTTYARRVEPDYDYFTDNVVLDGIAKVTSSDSGYDDTLNKMNSALNKGDIYKRAYINFLAQTSYNGYTDNAISNIQGDYDPYKVAICVAAAYGLSLKGLPDRSGTNMRFKKYESDKLDYTSTLNLTVDIDDRIYYPNGTPNEQLYPYGKRLADWLENDNATIPTNMMVPNLSDTKDGSGAYIYNVKTYTKYIKYNNTIYPCNGTQLVDMGYNRMTNMVGINTTLVNNNKYIFGFYTNALTRDLGTGEYFDQIEDSYRALYRKDYVENIRFDAQSVGTPKKLKYRYQTRPDSSSAYTDSTLSINSTFNDNKSGMYLSIDFDSKNIFGVNEVHLLNNTESNDANKDKTKTYFEIGNPTWINRIKTGIRESYDLSLSDGDPFNIALLPMTGMQGNVECDNINWNNLLRILGNNESIDLLHQPLKQARNGLDTEYFETVQNVSDVYTMDEDYNVYLVAQNTADPFPIDRHDLDKYRKTGPMEFDDEVNLYDFSFGYGYGWDADGRYVGQGAGFNKYKNLNNRGVVVFVIEDGKSFRNIGSGNDYERYENTTPKLHPKRMYVNNDGLICTKEYFDREMNEFDRNGNNPSFPQPTSIMALIKRIEELEQRVQQLENNQ